MKHTNSAARLRKWLVLTSIAASVCAAAPSVYLSAAERAGAAPANAPRPDAPISTDEFDRLLREVQPPAHETWRSIPWKTSILAAVAEARQTGKPIVLLTTNGHMLGCGCANVLGFRVTLDEPELAELIRTKFVAVAVYHQAAVNRKDADGDFYRRLRDDPKFTQKQPNAAVAFDADGKLLGFASDPNGGTKKMLEAVLRDFQPPAAKTDDAPAPTPIPAVAKLSPFAQLQALQDPQWAPTPPAGGLVLQVDSKNLDAPPPTRPSQGIGRNSLWVRKDEAAALAAGTLPESLTLRLARFNLWENSRGRAGVWKPEDVRELKVTLTDGRLAGTIVLGQPGAAKGKWFRGALLGFVESKDGQITRLDVVVRGEGRIDNGDDAAPILRAAIAFRLTDPTDMAYDVPPSGYLTAHEAYLR